VGRMNRYVPSQKNDEGSVDQGEAIEYVGCSCCYGRDAEGFGLAVFPKKTTPLLQQTEGQPRRVPTHLHLGALNTTTNIPTLSRHAASPSLLQRRRVAASVITGCYLSRGSSWNRDSVALCIFPKHCSSPPTSPHPWQAISRATGTTLQSASWIKRWEVTLGTRSSSISLLLARQPTLFDTLGPVRGPLIEAL